MEFHSPRRPVDRRAGAGCALLAVLMFVACGASGAADWPQFGQTATHDNSNPSERAFTPQNVASLAVKWNGDMGANTATEGGAVIAGDRVFVAGFDGRLSAFDIAGCGTDVCQPLWQGLTDNDITTTPAVRDGRVVVSSADRYIHVFDVNGCGTSTCDALWRGRLSSGAIDSSTAIAGGFIYVGDYGGQLSVFKLAGCGKDVCDPVWTAHAGPHEALNSTPAVWGGSVYVQTTFNTNRDVSGRLLVFPDGCGARTCGLSWSAELGGQAGKASAPIVALGKVFVGSSRRFGKPNRRDHVFAFNAPGCGLSTCQPIQIFDTGPEGIDTTLAVAGHTLFASTNKSTDPNSVGVVMAFDVFLCGVHCKPSWTGVNFTEGFLSAPVIAHDIVFVGKGPALEVDAGVFAFDANGCGQKICRALQLVRPSDSGFYLGAPLAVARDRIAFVSNDNNANRSQVTVIGLPD